MIEEVKVQKGTIIKSIPKAYKDDYIIAGWTEVKQNEYISANSDFVFKNNDTVFAYDNSRYIKNIR